MKCLKMKHNDQPMIISHCHVLSKTSVSDIWSIHILSRKEKSMDVIFLWHFTHPKGMGWVHDSGDNPHLPARLSRGRPGFMRLLYGFVYPSSTQLL